MPVPTHRADCQTIIWKTTCLDCHKPVYYFACTCGSKVFFDMLGAPWPLHSDSCPIYQARTLIQNGVNPRDIRNLLDSEARARGIPIPPEVDEILTVYGAPGKYYYVDELPSNEPCEIHGTVHEINQVNFFKRFDLDDTMIIRRLLGSLASQSHVEIVVRESKKSGVQVLKRWTFFLPEEYTRGLRMGMAISATLIGKSILNDDKWAIWTVEDIDW